MSNATESRHSPDRSLWWDGQRWLPAYSPDDSYWFDGVQWVPNVPTWYRRTRVAGFVMIVLGVVGMFGVFPFIYGDPGPGSEANQSDPAWFSVLAPVCIGLIVVGLTLVLFALARLSRRSKSRTVT